MVKFEVSDERAKNEGAIIVRTVKMIAVEMTAAATPEHLTATKAGQAARIEKMLQELKESLNACFQA